MSSKESQPESQPPLVDTALTEPVSDKAPVSQGAIPKVRGPQSESPGSSRNSNETLDNGVDRTFLDGKPGQDKEPLLEVEDEDRDIPADSRERQHSVRINLPEEGARRRDSKDTKSASQKDRPKVRRHQGEKRGELLSQKNNVEQEAKSSQKPNNLNQNADSPGRIQSKSILKNHTSKTNEENPAFNSEPPTAEPKVQTVEDPVQQIPEQTKRESKDYEQPFIDGSVKMSNKMQMQKSEGLPRVQSVNKEDDRSLEPRLNTNNKRIPGNNHARLSRANNSKLKARPGKRLREKSVMRLVVRSFTKGTDAAHALDVKIKGEHVDTSNFNKPEVDELIRQLIMYAIQIQTKLEINDEQSQKEHKTKSKKDQNKSTDVVEIFRRPHKSKASKPVKKMDICLIKSKLGFGISMRIGSPSSSKAPPGDKRGHSSTQSSPENNDKHSSYNLPSGGEVETKSSFGKQLGTRTCTLDYSKVYKNNVKRGSSLTIQVSKRTEKPRSHMKNELDENFTEKTEKSQPDTDDGKLKRKDADLQEKYHSNELKENKIREEGKDNEGENDKRKAEATGELTVGKTHQCKHDKCGKKRHANKLKPECNSKQKQIVGHAIVFSGDNVQFNESDQNYTETAQELEEPRGKKRRSDNDHYIKTKKSKSNHQENDPQNSNLDSKVEITQTQEPPPGTSKDSEKPTETKGTVASVKDSMNKMLVKITASKTVVAEGLTAAIRQKHKAQLTASGSKKDIRKKLSRGKLQSQSQMKTLLIPILFEETEPTCKSKSSIKINMEHSSEEGKLQLDLFGIHNNEAQGFGGQLKYSQSLSKSRKKCEDVETMRELLSSCVRKVEDVLNNLGQAQDMRSLKVKHGDRVVTCSPCHRTKPGTETYKEDIANKNPNKIENGVNIEELDTLPDTSQNIEMGNRDTIASKRKTSFSKENEDQCSGSINGECSACKPKKDTYYTKSKKDVTEIVQAKLDAGEFDEEIQKSLQKKTFSLTLADPDALERYRRSSLEKEQNKSSENELPVDNNNEKKIENEEVSSNHSKTNLAVSLNTQDRNESTIIGLSTKWPKGSSSRKTSSNKQLMNDTSARQDNKVSPSPPKSAPVANTLNSGPIISNTTPTIDTPNTPTSPVDSERTATPTTDLDISSVPVTTKDEVEPALSDSDKISIGKSPSPQMVSDPLTVMAVSTHSTFADDTTSEAKDKVSKKKKCCVVL